MKLLKEEVKDLQSQFLTEQEGGAKKLFLEGIFLQSEIKNRNGRYYPKPILEREVNRYTQESIDKKISFGELGHPAIPSLNPDRISHLITELKPDGNNWTGKAIVNPEGLGRVVYGIVDIGGVLSMSSRGLGSLKEDPEKGYQLVQDDFRLCVGADIVVSPSAPEAQMTSRFAESIAENAEWLYDASNNVYYQQILVDIKKEIKEAPKSELPRLNQETYLRFFDLLATAVNEDEGPLVASMANHAKVDSKRAWNVWNNAKIRAAKEGRHGDAKYVASIARRALGI